ncbi:MAG: hypothetical protein L6R45_29745 [Anaerolineae bacterium]|nr:hypothetical protein [Anaerolineae bacterium]
MTIDLTIRGIQEALARNNERIAMLEPDGVFGRIIKEVTIFTHAEAVKQTHVDTGALRASHRMTVTGVRGLVFIDPGSVNPRTRARPAEYGQVEHARGGGHAFYRIARQRAEVHYRNLVRQMAQEVAE